MSGLPLSEVAQLFDELPSITPISKPSTREAFSALAPDSFDGLQIDLLRLDQVHPMISGNKWYKLKQHLLAAQAAGKTRLLSFGGAHSNHLHALAHAGKLLDVETVGIVRGEEPSNLSPTLADCVEWGMRLEWLNRRDYRAISTLSDNDGHFAAKYPNAWIIPEGGAGASGIEGVRELFAELGRQGKISHSYIICPVGSGTTLAGIAAADLPGARCIGFSALKGAYDLEQKVERQLTGLKSAGDWEICHDYHFGGFAKLHPRLKDFISLFYREQKVLLDPIYTGKMLFGLMEWYLQGRIPKDTKVLVVHTGGLQGWRGFGEMWPVVGHDE